LKTAQLKELNPQVRHWTRKARQPFAGVITESDVDVGPTQSMVSALVKTMKEIGSPIKMEEMESYETPKIPIVKKKRRKADDLTPKPTPTPRRPKRKLPETPLTGIGELIPDSTQRIQRMRETPSSTPRQGG